MLLANLDGREETGCFEAPLVVVGAGEVGNGSAELVEGPVGTSVEGLNCEGSRIVKRITPFFSFRIAACKRVHWRNRIHPIAPCQTPGPAAARVTPQSPPAA